MPMFAARLLIVLFWCFATACGSRQVATTEREDRNTITDEQIRQNGYRTAYEAVEALHPRWLVTRPDALTVEREILVYLDNSRLGGVQTLRQIAAAQVAMIQHIDPATAINRWGVDHGQGVIMVVSRR